MKNELIPSTNTAGMTVFKSIPSFISKASIRDKKATYQHFETVNNFNFFIISSVWDAAENYYRQNQNLKDSFTSLK